MSPASFPPVGRPELVKLISSRYRLFDSSNKTGSGMDQSVGAAHSGGSCQVALLYDGGTSFHVVKSFEGNCPRVRTPGALTNHYDRNQDYSFTIPADSPAGDRVILAWTWFNASGNREMYMSCCPIAIIGDGGVPPHGPPLFIANLQVDELVSPTDDDLYGKCHIPDDTSIIFPQDFVRDTEVDRALVARNLQRVSFDPQVCSSANQDIRVRLMFPGRREQLVKRRADTSLARKS